MTADLLGNGWEWTKVKDVVRETLFSRIYRACKEWQGWTGRNGFFERMDLVRRMMIATIENDWVIGLGPRGLSYSVCSGELTEYFAQISKLVDELNLHNQVTFLGRVPANEMRPLYRAARLVVSPGWVTVGREIPMPLLEMA